MSGWLDSLKFRKQDAASRSSAANRAEQSPQRAIQRNDGVSWLEFWVQAGWVPAIRARQAVNSAANIAHCNAVAYLLGEPEAEVNRGRCEER